MDQKQINGLSPENKKNIKTQQNKDQSSFWEQFPKVSKIGKPANMKMGKHFEQG